MIGVRCALRVVCWLTFASLCVACCVWFDDRCVLFAGCCALVVGCYLLLSNVCYCECGCLLFVVCYVLFVVCWLSVVCLLCVV